MVQVWHQKEGIIQCHQECKPKRSYVLHFVVERKRKRDGERQEKMEKKCKKVICLEKLILRNYEDLVVGTPILGTQFSVKKRVVVLGKSRKKKGWEKKESEH